jgi:hypothetical protein
VKETEQLNPNGIVDDSKLIVKIVDGVNFYTSKGAPFIPVVFMFCENQRYNTTNEGQAHQQSTWNETFAM